MSREFLCTVDSIPELRPVLDRHNSKIEDLQAQHSFLHNKMKRLMKETNDSKKLFWDTVHPILKKAGVIPETYSTDTSGFTLEVDGEKGIVYKEPDGENPLAALLKAFKM